MEDNVKEIGQSLYNFQAALSQEGSSLEEYIRTHYSDKWLSDELYAALAIRTTMVDAMCSFLVSEGLLNLEKVLLSIITDPLAHDVEHTPSIAYKGHTYLTTHSMIYSKFIACSNPKVKGIFVDSPNIRLEIENPSRIQRSKYVIDFSQIDIEVRRSQDISLEQYFREQDKVRELLEEDYEQIQNLFERMIIAACKAVNKHNGDELKTLGVVLEVPDSPFPCFMKDESEAKYGPKNFEAAVGEQTTSQFFWIRGLMRENYDLIYPYLNEDGSKRSLDGVPSSDIFNYDIAARSIDAKTGRHSPALEILSGAIREWLYQPIVERILDNRVLPAKPVFKKGNIENINELGGYGPFLYFAQLKDDRGRPLFPATMGGGIGIERSLFALLRGEKINKIEDVMFFGKNPDSHPLYLF